MPVLVKSSFTEALLVVLKCTDASNHPFEDVRAKECLHCLAQRVLTCQHDLERVKHDSNFVRGLCLLGFWP